MKIKLFFVYFFSFILLFFTSYIQSYATHSPNTSRMASRFMHNNGSTNWEVAYKFWYRILPSGSRNDTSTTWFAWTNYLRNFSGGTGMNGPFDWSSNLQIGPDFAPWENKHPPYTIQWGTTCKDPQSDPIYTSTSGNPMVYVFYSDVTYNKAAANNTGKNISYAYGNNVTLPPGTVNKCPFDCTPNTCGASRCGSIGDGCGGTLNCGGCGADYCTTSCDRINNFCNSNNYCDKSNLGYTWQCNNVGSCCTSNVDCANNKTCVNHICDNRYTCNNGTGSCYLNVGGNWADKGNCDTNCIKDTKDLIVSALTFPSGIRGRLTNPSVLTIKNIGNSQITGNFTVRLCNGDGACGNHPVSQTVSPNESIDLSGAIEFNLPRGNPANTYNATATVDSNDNIVEDNEGNNSRTDVYTTTNPNCDIISCGACSTVCGAGTKTCTYTSYSGGGACNTNPAPDQPCNPSCPAATPNCVANACVCSAVGVPTGLAPSGTLYDSQTRNITWNAVAGATAYAIRVDDLANGWNCAGAGTPGDVCQDIAGTAFTYNFQAGHSYNIWVHSKSACGTYSAQTSTSVNVQSYIWGHIFIDNNNDGIQNNVAGYPNDTNYAGTTVTKTGGATENFTSDGSGNYIFWENPGTYTVSVAPGGNYAIAPAASQTVSVGPSKVVNFRLVPLSYIWGHVYIDNDNSNSENAGDGVYSGLTVNLSGGGSSRAPTTTDGGGNYGFWSLLPGGYTTSFTPSASYIAPITQQSTILPPDRVLSYRVIPTSWYNPKGNHDAASCTVTTGWTCDPDNYGQGIDVHLYKDGPAGTGTFMGATTANIAREAAVAAQCGGNANHGFSFSIPNSIYDGATHPIYAYAINIGNGNANPLLTSSPKSITCARSIVNIHVYNDNNGNGVEDAGETGSLAKTVTVSGNGAGTYTTNASGNIQITNLLPGSSTATVTLPSGWTATTANPATAFYPPSPAQLNFGIKPPAPTCTSLTANPISVNPGGTSILTCNNPTSPTGQALTYNWYDDTREWGGTIQNIGTNHTSSATWNSPNPWWSAQTASPSVAVCNPGGGSCTNYSTNIDIVPLYSISGNVFEDINKDGFKNGAESNYAGSITITSSNGSVPTYSNGAFTVANLPAGNYKITYTSLPDGYSITYPNIPPPFAFTVTVGGGCAGGGSNSATCTNGNISNLNFGIIYGSPWIQSGGSDIWFNGGFSEPIPSGATCQSYASITGPGGTPGIIYSNGTADFGKTGGQASTNPYNWAVNSIYTPVTPNSVRSSYSYISALVAQNHITPTNLNIVCPNLSACNLGNLANGVYTVTGDVTLIGNGGSGKYSFPPNKDFVFLINGNLTINTEISVPTTSTALFSTSRDITVAATVGTSTITSTTPNLEGWFSAGKNFNIRGTSTCPTPDLRLNVAGAIVVNAELTGGSFNNTERDLCAGNLSCPVFYITERPDFTLNAPTFLQVAPRIWQEIAP